MTIDLEALLRPLEGDNPAGPDLSYSSARHQIEEAFQVIDAGPTVALVDGELVAREDDAQGGADWRKIIKLILEEAALTRDLWLGVYLTRAGARAGDLELVGYGLDYTRGLLEQWWDQGWPSLEEDGPIARATACAALAQGPSFLRPLMATALLKHNRHGAFTGADFVRFAAADGHSEDGYGAFRAAVQDAPPEEMEAIRSRLSTMRESLAAIDEILTGHLGSASETFDGAYKALDAITRALTAFAAGETPALSSDNSDDPSGGEPPAAGAQPPGGGGGKIATRQDVVRALDAIIEFYRRSEPASPIPLVLRRARTWVTMDFLQVLEDIAPNATGEARTVLGREEN